MSLWSSRRISVVRSGPDFQGPSAFSKHRESSYKDAICFQIFQCARLGLHNASDHNATKANATMIFKDFPGYLGWTSRGVIAIHADWPAYAIEHGKEYAIERVGQFPKGYRFFGIDSIDQCILFRVGERDPKKDDYDESLFHIALWHEDILELFSEGWVDGVGGITPREWARRRCEQLRELVLMLGDGRIESVPLPDPEEFSDSEATIALVSSDGMVLTDSGEKALQNLMGVRRSELAPPIAAQVEKLLEVGAFDAAVREACVMLEVYLKRVSGTSLFGAKLVERYVSDLKKSDKLIDAQLKWLRTELRSCFSFVRNEYMHNIHVLTEPQCIAVLCRVSALYSHLEGIAK